MELKRAFKRGTRRTGSASRSLAPKLVWALAAAGALASWLLPSQKEAAVGGRLSYPEFMLALILSALLLSLTPICFAVSSQRRKLHSFRVIAIWLGVAAPIGLWELGARFWPQHHLMDNPWYIFTGKGTIADNDLPFVRPPHLKWTGKATGDLAFFANERDPSARLVTFQTDAHGFHNPTEADRADVVFIGDSFTEAGNVGEEESFVSRVGQRLGSSVRNLGLAGQGPPQELIVLKKYGLDFHPRKVVWQIAEANDLDDAVDFKAWEEHGRPRYTNRPDQMLSSAEAWKRRSPTRQLFDALGGRQHWPLAGEFTEASGITVRILFLPGRLQSPRAHPGWPIIVDAITQGTAILRERNIKLILVLVPTKLRVMGQHVRFNEFSVVRNGRTEKIVGSLPEGWDLAPQNTLASYLKALCEQLGTPFVDTTPTLREHTAGGELVFLPMDTHLSAHGHQIVADMIADTLAKKAQADQERSAPPRGQ
jgi:hypothetical protein